MTQVVIQNPVTVRVETPTGPAVVQTVTLVEVKDADATIVSPQVSTVQVVSVGAQGPAGIDGGASVTSSIVASEDVAIYLPITSDGFEGDSTDLTQLGDICGVTDEAILSGFSGVVITQGEITNSAWTFVTGDIIFLNGSVLSTVAPSTGYSQKIGQVIRTDTIKVEIEEPIKL